MNDQLSRTSKQLKQKQLEESEQNKQILLLMLFGIGIGIILIFVILAYLITKKSAKAIQLQNENQKKILNNSVVTISNYNAMSEALIKKIKQIALHQTNKKLSDELYDLSQNIQDSAVGTKSKELKDLDFVIQSVNDGFVKKLCRKYPNLSSNEITLSIYLRMNFSTKQIAEMKGTSENSIDVSRSRLRSKLGLKGENMDLSTFLNSI